MPTSCFAEMLRSVVIVLVVAVVMVVVLVVVLMFSVLGSYGALCRHNVQGETPDQSASTLVEL